MSSTETERLAGRINAAIDWLKSNWRMLAAAAVTAIAVPVLGLPWWTLLALSALFWVGFTIWALARDLAAPALFVLAVIGGGAYLVWVYDVSASTVWSAVHSPAALYSAGLAAVLVAGCVLYGVAAAFMTTVADRLSPLTIALAAIGLVAAIVTVSEMTQATPAVHDYRQSQHAVR
ncbi:hypothetical protein [Bradyrhizobium manausense]|uniref:Uncharacterized protein n=1 Tax=Bradyrhizobium manausense TaxID=989370 RepID=A0A0R3D4T7_9BRAD|nr:hypothetical protein [Bradyrhizobium manausense]KRQ03294.1 hypothetical protein AOQ71_31700 [Bradyrhizobium manausense]